MEKLKFKKSELKNGIRILTESHDDSRAVSIGVWVLTGTRDEIPEIAGISHFLEHLVFKGTKSRNAYQIAKSLEALGGELNAYTTREYTCYHALVLKDHWVQALDVLCDLISNMKLTPKEFKLEKGVVLQEIAMSEDNEEDIIYDHFFNSVFGDNPLGRNILGSPASIALMNRKQILDYYEDNYSGSNVIIGGAGSLNHHEFAYEVEKRLKKKSPFKPSSKRMNPSWQIKRDVIEKNSEQLHMLVGFPTTSFKDKTRFHAYILNTLIGGGMTSKLYQSVREKRGLVYSIHSTLNTFIDCGQIMIYASADPKKMPEVAEIVFKELKKLKKNGISKSDFEMYKKQIVGNILLGSDDIENRMSSICVNEMVFGEYRQIEETIQEIEKIDLKSMNRFIKEYLDLKKLSGVLLGAQANQLKDFWQKLK